MARPLFPLSGLLVSAILAASPLEANAQGAAGEIALSDESVQLRYLAWGSGQATELGFGLFLNENRDIIASTHYYLDVFSVAVGAEIRYELLRRQGIAVTLQGAYAPDILTFGSADNLLDLTGRIELPLTNSVIGYAGYRMLEFDLLTGSREVEESAHVGIRYLF